jgi:uncharacterized protein (DUF2237 family)
MSKSFEVHALQRPAQLLSCSGTFPVIGLALAMIVMREAPEWMIQALTSYAAIILGFLGGIHWGMGLLLHRVARLYIAVLPALYAWGVLQLPWPVSGWALALGFLLMLGLDWRSQVLPAWYRQLRLSASVVVILNLCVAAWLVTATAQSTPQSSIHPTLNETAINKNVLGTALQLCSSNPRTGFYRNGFCETGADDVGTHTVCAVLTQDFLDYTLSRGNDLITPRPDYNFPGLNPGEGWCLCALRWQEALRGGFPPTVVLDATNKKTLDHVQREDLVRHAWPQLQGE